VVADIGLERGETENALVTPEILERVPRRRPDQNKYTAGSVLIVGGSRGLTGAPSLAAEAAFRADAGYVAVAVPDSTLQVFETRLLEAVKLGCPEDDGKISPRAVDPIAEFAAKAGAVALGPGLGRGDARRCARGGSARLRARDARARDGRQRGRAHRDRRRLLCEGSRRAPRLRGRRNRAAAGVAADPAGGRGRE